MQTYNSSEHASSGGRLVTTDGRILPLESIELSTQAGGGVARVSLVQHFRNPYAEPLHVTYQVPLPHDGVVAGYAFRIGARRVVGQVDALKKARERYESALIEGKTAALLVSERTNLFTQQLGNVPPGERISVELSVDQRLRWLSEGMWEWRFPTVAPPRYLGAEGRVPDASRVTVSVTESSPVAASVRVDICDLVQGERRPECPSHPIDFRALAGAFTGSVFGVPLDRDVVVRWPVAEPAPGVRLQSARPDSRTAASDFGYGLLTVVPPSVPTDRVCRDLVVLVDVSGSMSGPPMDRAKRVVSEVIAGLCEQDRVELIAFSDQPIRWKAEPVRAGEAVRQEAIAWVKSLSAGGSTEMREGIREALRPLRAEAQRQVLLVTDGHIGFEPEIVREICSSLPRGSRLHTVGVGSSVNRALTGPAARAGHGAEVLVNLEEDAERAVARLTRAMGSPVLVDLQLSGDAVVDCAPSAVLDLMAGAPVLLSVKLQPRGGELVLRGRTPTGTFERRLTVPALGLGEGSPAIAALYARERVEDLEMELAAGEGRSQVEPRIERIGLDFQVSTRLTAWIAVTEEATVDPSAPTRQQTVPQALPHGMSAEGLGLRSRTGPMPVVARSVAPSQTMLGGAFASRAPGAPPAPAKSSKTELFEPVGEESASYDDESAAFEQKESAAAPPPPPAAAPPKGKAEESKRRSTAFRLPGSLGKLFGGERQKAAEIRLRGRLVHSDGQLRVFELEVDGTLDWNVPAEVQVLLADGSRLTVKVERLRTTQRATLEAGFTPRLALAAFVGEAVGLEWTVDGTSYRVKV